MGSCTHFLYQKLVLFIGTFWVSLSTYFLPLLGFFRSYLLRFKRYDNCSKDNPKNWVILSEENSGKDSDIIEERPEVEEDSTDGFTEKETPEFSFRFKFPTYEEFIRSRGEIGDSIRFETEVVSSNPKELTRDTTGGSFRDEDIAKDEFCSDRDFPQINSEARAIDEETPEESARDFCADDVGRKQIEEMTFTKEVEEDNPKNWVILSEENSGKDSDIIEERPEVEEDSTDGFTEKETPEFSFKFKFPTYEEFIRSRGEIGDSIRFETEVVSSNPEELTRDTTGGSFRDEDIAKDEFCSDRDFPQINSEARAIDEEIPEESARGFCADDVGRKQIEEMTFTKEEENPVDAGKVSLSEEIQVQYEKESLAMDSDSDSFSSSPLRSIRNHLIDSYSDGFLSDRDFGGESWDFDETLVDESDMYSNKDHEEGEFDEDDMFSNEEQKAQFETVGNFNSDFLSDKDFPEKIDKSNDKLDSEKVNSKDSSDWDSDDSSKLETLWEHQELMEQLKNELKKVKATGLPTILEESDESPKIMEDLKPWKFDEKFQRVDRIDDLHKLYKSYRERMRKFDILNYQKMYATGFLQLKDPLKSISTTQKSWIPSIFLEKIFLGKRKKIRSDPTMKFVEELQSELEVVYVGQMCLSWEILQWQYGKALDLWESDHPGSRLYNEVAGEFQQFQVLMQRFIEDEHFQGPRVQTYVKSRCVVRNLLQVPVIREDTRDKKKAMKRGDFAITSDVLIEIMEESIRIFWRFVRADKDCFNAKNFKCWKGPQAKLQNPEDSELFFEIRANLQKKEKKLRDLLRTGNCILKRFQKSREDISDHVLYFFSQVDMKLVARVLNMSKLTTDQLLWCRNKLAKISFVNRKIRVEPSFLLFPC